MSVVALTKGSVFARRYCVGRCIATGGMGAVYEVMHLETERRCALKVMLPHIVSSDELRERFGRRRRSPPRSRATSSSTCSTRASTRRRASHFW